MTTTRSVMVALCAALLSASGCDSCESSRSPSALVVSTVEVDLVLRGAVEETDESDVDLEGLVRSALGEARSLRLSAGEDRGRLRVRATVSPDGATGALHATVVARLDRAGAVPLDWEVTRLRPASAGGDHGSAAVREHVAAAVGEAMASLDIMAAVQARDEAGLIEALGSDDAPARSAAARVLGRRRVEEAVEPLCQALGAGPDRVSRDVATALALIGDEAAVPCLLGWGEGSPEHMETVIEVLGALPGSRPRSALETLARDGGAPEVRRLAAARLAAMARREKASGHEGHDHGEEEPPAHLSPFLKALQHEDRNVRLGAARALGEQRAREAVEPLCEMLGRDDPEDAAAALDALAGIGDRRAIPCLLRWSDGAPRRVAAIIPALVVIGGPESRGVLEMLGREHESEAIRTLAAAGLRDLERAEQASPPTPAPGTSIK